MPHGIEIKSMEEVGTNTKISACSKHLSSFAVSVSYRVTVIEVPETSGPELRKRIYTSDQALLHYFTMVFGLAWFVLVILVAWWIQRFLSIK